MVQAAHTGSDKLRATLRRWGFGANIAFGLAAALVVAAAAVAMAVAVGGGAPTFQVEGNLLANSGDDGDLDWDDGDLTTGVIEATRNEDATCTQTNEFAVGGPGEAGSGLLICDGSQGGATDQNTFTQGSKNEDGGNSATVEWEVTGGSSPKKADLSEVYNYAKVGDGDDPDETNDDLFLVFDLTRTDVDGSTNADFEFNQQPISCENPDGTGTCTQERVQDDVIIAFDFESGGIPRLRLFRFFEDSGATDEDCANAPQVDFPCYVEETGGDATGFVNTEEIDAADWGAVHCEPTSADPSSGCDVKKKIPANGNMEGFVDVTSFFGDDEFDICSGFGQMMAKTRSSDELNSTLKDLAGPRSVDLDACSASIEIEPDAVNEVDDEHTFTVTVNKEVGDSSEPAEGVDVDVTLTEEEGADAIVVEEKTTCDVPAEGIDTEAGDTDADGQCEVVFTSSSGGNVTGTATATVEIFGSEFTVTTDGSDNNSGPAVKHFVDSAIAIGPSAVNEVGDSHDFTVTVTPEAPSGVTIDSVTLDSLTVSPDPDSTSGCDSLAAQPDGTWTCTLTISSDSADKFTAEATATANFSDDSSDSTASVTRTTDGIGDNSDPAVKRFVDAKIAIAPLDDDNSIEETHTLTATVEQDDGLDDGEGGDGVTGFAPASGVDVAFTLNNDTANTTFVGDTSTCTTDSSGECSVDITSDEAGGVDIEATTTFTLAGVELTRTTDGTGENSAAAHKDFVAGSIAWTKADNAGDPLAGATFTVCLTEKLNTDDGTFTDVDPDECFDVTDNDTTDADPADGKFKVDELVLGRYEITEKTAPDGFEKDTSVAKVLLDLDDPDATDVFTFDNERPIIKLTEFGYTNSPDGDADATNSGVVDGTTVYTVVLENFGSASATLSGSLAATDDGDPSVIEECTSGSTGTTGVTLDGCTLAWSGVGLAAAGETGDSRTFALTVDYAGSGGEVITADLFSQYMLNNLTRDASGSPAQITYTISGD